MKHLFNLYLLCVTITTTSAQTHPKLIFVEGGTFTMGNTFGEHYNDQNPTHSVTLSDFYISETEITVKQYRDYCKATGKAMPKNSFLSGRKSNHPIANITWNNALEYCQWLSEQLNRNISLPTEAQWEYAARGGKHQENNKYSGGYYDWRGYHKKPKTRAVSETVPNALGLYGMSGNVWEWCQDWYAEDFYSKSPSKNPKGANSGKNRVMRGGSCLDNATSVAYRASEPPKYSNRFIGFRVVVN